MYKIVNAGACCFYVDSEYEEDKPHTTQTLQTKERFSNKKSVWLRTRGPVWSVVKFRIEVFLLKIGGKFLIINLGNYGGSE
jgi:hypothetical protein